MIKLERVDNELQKSLNEILCREVKDPRLESKFMSVTGVNTTKDLKYAKVFVSVMPQESQKEVLKVLNSAGAFIRSLLFERLKIRTVPNLTFYPDNSIENGMKIDAIIRKINEKTEDNQDKE